MTNRNMPAEFAELMELAVAGGNIDEVSLVFEGLGYDFHAPIGWLLYLRKVAPELSVEADGKTTSDSEPNLICVDSQVSRPTPSSYVGVCPRSGEAQYWDAAAIKRWIEAPRHAGTAGEPVMSPAEHVQMMVTAAKQGWSVTREIRRYGRRHTAALIPSLNIPTSMSYRFEAHNYSYNDETSEHYRGAGAELSMSLALGTTEQSTTWNYALRDSERVDPAEIVAEVSQTPPWHTRVARFDENLEEWVL
ncbi:hypothetical protein [Gordonia sp. KTR9]|uniref:hypothetical protein n=2 Tax=Gordonia TaxID=2053 RepID=UPI000299A4FB|nr:hypothetical protein [Gordonia sp. KTR9]ADK69020.2 hypothetical protein KTR9_4939 [Gordonia sp. KTR9]